MTFKTRNNLGKLAIVLLFWLLQPWRATIAEPSIDGVGLGMTASQVAELWGKPHSISLVGESQASIGNSWVYEGEGATVALTVLDYWFDRTITGVSMSRN